MIIYSTLHWWWDQTLHLEYSQLEEDNKKNQISWQSQTVSKCALVIEHKPSSETLIMQQRVTLKGTKAVFPHVVSEYAGFNCHSIKAMLVIHIK